MIGSIHQKLEKQHCRMKSGEMSKTIYSHTTKTNNCILAIMTQAERTKDKYAKAEQNKQIFPRFLKLCVMISRTINSNATRNGTREVIIK